MEFILKIDVQGLVRWLSQEVLLHKYGDLSLDPQHPCEKLGKVVHACKPSPGEMETGGFLGLGDHQSS